MIIIDSILDVENYIEDAEAVIFDLDDTLYSEKDYVRSGYKEIAEYFNKPKLEIELWNAFLAGEKAIDFVFEKYNMTNLKNDAIHIYRFHSPNIKLYNGVSQLLERIRKVKKVGIITDGRPEGQRAKIKALGLNVDEIIITDELGGIKYRKPCPIAYQEISRRINVSIGNMIYVGDNINKDFIAPNNIGMRSIWFRNCDGIYYK